LFKTSVPLHVKRIQILNKMFDIMLYYIQLVFAFIMMLQSAMHIFLTKQFHNF